MIQDQQSILSAPQKRHWASNDEAVSRWYPRLADRSMFVSLYPGNSAVIGNDY